ncbi:pancreatic lipase-related protein 2 [Prionailurus iriomotensis]
MLPSWTIGLLLLATVREIQIRIPGSTPPKTETTSLATRAPGTSSLLTAHHPHLLTGKEICYGHLGCFSDGKPWTGILQRPLKLFPWAPKDIDTRFLLYTNENPNNFQLITATDLDTVEASNFQLERKTRFIIHGFIDKGEESWLLDMCKKMFQVEKVNCICVDWRRGAKTQYTQAVHNIRVVGAEIAFLIQRLSVKPCLGHIPWVAGREGTG